MNDQANEGHYLWTDSQKVTYTNWANGLSKPPSSPSEDCAYSGGRNNGYHWVVSSCEDCRNFTCKSGRVIHCKVLIECIFVTATEQTLLVCTFCRFRRVLAREVFLCIDRRAMY